MSNPCNDVNVNNSSENSNGDCLSCVQLMRQVLSQSDSKPARLLRSMLVAPPPPSLPKDHPLVAMTQSASTRTTSVATTEAPSFSASVPLLFRATENGLQVQIPVEKPHRESLLQRLTTRRYAPAITTPAAENGVKSTTTTGSSDSNQHDVGSSGSGSGSGNSTAAKANANANVLQLATSSSVSTSEIETEWLSLICRSCADRGPESNARAFVMGPTPLSIVVCHNRLQQRHSTAATAAAATTTTATAPTNSTTTTAPTNSTTTAAAAAAADTALAEMEEILTHEFIHIYDARQLQFNLLHCQNLAYSEVRAARDAECANLVAVAGNNYLHNHHSKNKNSPWSLFGGGGGGGSGSTAAAAATEECVRTKATTATRNLFPLRAGTCINAVFDRAYVDHRPLGVGGGAFPHVPHKNANDASNDTTAQTNHATATATTSITTAITPCWVESSSSSSPSLSNKRTTTRTKGATTASETTAATATTAAVAATTLLASDMHTTPQTVSDR